MTFFSIFISVVIIQRIVELVISHKNENYLKSTGAMEYDKLGYKYIVLLHVFFFISIFTEYFIYERELIRYWKILLIIFLITQYLRYWSISSLGKRWCTKILVFPKKELIRTGPYRYLNHPNYLAVSLEIGIIPFLFTCYYTAVIFSLLNFIIIKRRIRIEEEALKLHVLS